MGFLNLIRKLSTDGQVERAEGWTGTNCNEHLFNTTCMPAIHFVKPSANITLSNPHINLYIH